MKKILIPMLMITVFATVASAEFLNPEGTFPDMGQEPNWLADRIGVVNDGSFENGPCGGGSSWTCASTGASNLVIDVATLGLSNYDGNYAAYLGGFDGSGDSWGPIVSWGGETDGGRPVWENGTAGLTSPSATLS